jgi:hypothetical protein
MRYTALSETEGVKRLLTNSPTAQDRNALKRDRNGTEHQFLYCPSNVSSQRNTKDKKSEVGTTCSPTGRCPLVPLLPKVPRVGSPLPRAVVALALGPLSSAAQRAASIEGEDATPISHHSRYLFQRSASFSSRTLAYSTFPLETRISRFSADRLALTL